MAGAPEDDRPARKPPIHAIGQDLAVLSADELTERISLLRQEIDRIETVRRAKLASRDAADAFFKR